MDKVRIEKGDWLVVCDGRKALILENVGDEMFPNLHIGEVHEQPNPSTGAQGSDAPGRLHGASGGVRSLVEQTDWHDEAERSFLRGLAGRLDAAVSAGETSALTMVASPRALGMIRADYSDVVRKALQGEVGKDLVKLPVTRSRNNCCCRALRNSNARGRTRSAQ
ncbi:host attachment protein [Bradyrhizobium daqingense]|uniref:Protein required for attachment to host cells n=1 Tax=Bradyrhizobium daqingense TaxID=993502 RepID=A0A562LLW1_9BRAD|nr:host attachment protein [Bradyrhizobium daqingense]TWI08576.1 protein required for attachment to host cells [Bradyrhizobium daqingense]UFS87492.1 host attachment protein [Bradyrhizobium daqingense]